MWLCPFTAEFDSEVHRLTAYIERERTSDEQVKNAADRLESEYGSMEYGVFAVMAKQWVLERGRRETEFLLSYGERILSGKAKIRRRLDSETICKRIAEFEESLAEHGSCREFLETLRGRLGNTESLVRIVSICQKAWFQTKQVSDLINLIENCSPKAIEQASKEMQARFTAFRDACVSFHEYLKRHYSDKLKSAATSYESTRRVTVDRPLDELGEAINEQIRFQRALNSAERTFKPKPEFYKFRQMRESNQTWPEISKIEELPSKDGERMEADNWKNEKQKGFSTQEQHEFEDELYTGARPYKQYWRRQIKEVDFFSRYMKALTELGLRVTLTPFQDHSPFFLTLSDNTKKYAELIKVLDIVLLGKK